MCSLVSPPSQVTWVLFSQYTFPFVAFDSFLPFHRSTGNALWEGFMVHFLPLHLPPCHYLLLVPFLSSLDFKPFTSSTASAYTMVFNLKQLNFCYCYGLLHSVLISASPLLVSTQSVFHHLPSPAPLSQQLPDMKGQLPGSRSTVQV